jgi:polyhydroxyalkanoate synthesis regulator phasin
MNSMDRNPLEIVQQLYYTGIGAAAAAIESLQDEAKRQEYLTQLRVDARHLATVCAEKGRLTEAQARELIQAFIAQQRQAPSTPEPAARESADLAADIQTLLETLRALRQDLQQDLDAPTS